MQKPNELLDDFIEIAPKWRRKRWSRLLLIHFFMMGAGLFYVDNQLKRRWIYVVIASYAWLSFFNVYLRFIPELEGFHNRTFKGAMSIIISWGIVYIIGTGDACIALWLRKQGRIR